MNRLAWEIDSVVCNWVLPDGMLAVVVIAVVAAVVVDLLWRIDNHH